jgi:hypothetical protein
MGHAEFTSRVRIIRCAVLTEISWCMDCSRIVAPLAPLTIAVGFVGKQESLSGNRWCPDGILGLGVPLGTNRLVIVRCGLLDRETVELITKHRTLVLFH